MNFLAHCALATADDDLIVGGFLGDFVKGTVPDTLPKLVARGVRLHRRIDAFSNTEPHIRSSVARLPEAHRRLAPPFVDLLADHLLARDFECCHGEALGDFTDRVHAAIERREVWLGASARRYFAFMRDTALLHRYQDLSTVARAFERIAARFGRSEAVAPFMACVETHFDAFAADFAGYYPRLTAHADDWIATAAANP